MQMKIRFKHDDPKLNLETEVEYKINKFPAGEVGFVWEGTSPYVSDFGVEIYIDVNLYTADDYMILCGVLSEIKLDSLFYKKEYDSNLITLKELNIGYLGYSRQDKFVTVVNEESDNFHEIPMVDVALDMIMAHVKLSETKVTILDPHSTIKRDGIKINHPTILFPDVEPIFPDEGAYARYARYQSSMYGSKPALFAMKRRGDKGNIISYELNESMVKFDPNKDYVVVDDICDGGATFLSLAKLLTEKGHKGKLYLQVTHGLFTKGKEELLKYYDDIKFITEM